MPAPIELIRILRQAYAPCPEFEATGACVREMRWQPEAGHVPRGFCGAFGEASEVELILVFAEPGDPHNEERHFGFESAYNYIAKGFREGLDLFHRNVRKILDECWPETPFDEQMRKVWVTDSVLCSARTEGGPVSRAAETACGNRYLKAQLDAFPDALIVAVGGKAQRRLRPLGVHGVLPVYSTAPPGCNRRQAAESWKQIAIELRRRRRASGLPLHI